MTARPNAQVHDWEYQMLHPIKGQLKAGFSTIMHHNGKYYSYAGNGLSEENWGLFQSKMSCSIINFPAIISRRVGIIGSVIAGERQR